MENSRADKSMGNTSNAAANQIAGVKGKSIPAVPALQKKEQGDDEPAQLETVPVDKKEYAAKQLRSDNSQTQNTGEDTRSVPVQTENKTGLPDNLKLGVENLSGLSLGDVKVHYNSDKPAQLQALDYAQGTDIHVGPG